jgi:hypothetical protein
MKSFKTKQFLVVFTILSVLLSACNGIKRIPTHVDVLVKDGEGRLLPNKKVNLLATRDDEDYNIYSKVAATAISDKDGKVAFDYVWESDESSTTFFQVVPADDSLYKAVTYAPIPLPDYNSKEAKHTVNVVLDKVVPFKIRLKSKRKDVMSHKTNVSLKDFKSSDTKTISRNLHSSGGSGNVPVAFDQTFNASAFEKRVCIIQTSFTYADKLISGSSTLEIDLKTFRDSVYLIEF